MNSSEPENQTSQITTESLRGEKRTRYGYEFAVDIDTDQLIPLPGILTPAQRMLNDAVDDGHRIKVICEGDTDYFGSSPVKAWEAILDVTCSVEIILVNKHAKHVGWALVVKENGIEDLVDYSINSWISEWWNEVEREYR